MSGLHLGLSSLAGVEDFDDVVFCGFHHGLKKRKQEQRLANSQWKTHSSNYTENIKQWVKLANKHPCQMLPQPKAEFVYREP